MFRIGSFLFVDSDKENPKAPTQKGEKVITYGMNPKSTITISAINDEKATICVQRGFTNSSGREIEPQEIVVNNNENEDVLLNTAISLVVGPL